MYILKVFVTLDVANKYVSSNDMSKAVAWKPERTGLTRVPESYDIYYTIRINSSLYFSVVSLLRLQYPLYLKT